MCLGRTPIAGSRRWDARVDDRYRAHALQGDERLHKSPQSSSCISQPKGWLMLRVNSMVGDYIKALIDVLRKAAVYCLRDKEICMKSLGV